MYSFPRNGRFTPPLFYNRDRYIVVDPSKDQPVPLNEQVRKYIEIDPSLYKHIFAAKLPSHEPVSVGPVRYFGWKNMASSTLQGLPYNPFSGWFF